MKRSSHTRPSTRLAAPCAGHRRGESGSTLMELLVGVLIFSVVGLALVGVSTQSLNDLGLESRTTLETFELKRGLDLLSSELRMSSMLSPYLPGTNDGASRCSNALQVSARSMTFLVALDDPSANGGMRPYYVGYRYDPAARQLYRGEIPAASAFSCTPPSGDPTSAPYARPVASNVVEIDSNGDGAADSAFAWSNGVLAVNLGTRVDGAGTLTKRQSFSTRIYGRIL